VRSICQYKLPLIYLMSFHRCVSHQLILFFPNLGMQSGNFVYRLCLHIWYLALFFLFFMGRRSDPVLISTCLKVWCFWTWICIALACLLNPENDQHHGLQKIPYTMRFTSCSWRVLLPNIHAWETWLLVGCENYIWWAASRPVQLDIQSAPCIVSSAVVDDELQRKSHIDYWWWILLKLSGCCCWAAAKFSDLFNEKVEGSHLDNEIQSPRSPRSAPIDEGLTQQIS
jgi:hypothetical protein